MYVLPCVFINVGVCVCVCVSVECILLHCYHGLVLLLSVHFCICSIFQLLTAAIDKTIRNTFFRCKLIYVWGGMENGKWQKEKVEG